MTAALGTGGVRALYFAYFAFAGIFAPYLSLWLGARGLHILDIAWLMVIPHTLRVVGPPVWGWLADRSGRRVLWLRVSAGIAVVVALCFPWVHSLHGLALLIVLLNFQITAQMPIGETLALDQARGDVARYGRIRLWGSVGFVVTVLIGGPLLDWLGIEAFPWLVVAALALLAGVALRLPEVSVARAARNAVPLGTRMREPAVMAFFGSAFLMVFAHASLYVFLSLFLERHGYSRTTIGLMWGLGVAAEITMFMVQRRFFERWPAMPLLVVAFAVAVVRFVMLGVSGGVVWVLVLAQLLHSVTFALHHSAAMAVLHRWFEPAQQARAQAWYIVVGYGMGATVGGLVAGELWEAFVPAAVFFGAAAAALLGLIIIAWAARRDARRPVGGLPRAGN